MRKDYYKIQRVTVTWSITTGVASAQKISEVLAFFRRNGYKMTDCIFTAAKAKLVGEKPLDN